MDVHPWSIYEFMLKVEDMLTIANKLSTKCLGQMIIFLLGQWDWFHCPIHATTHVLHIFPQPNNGMSSIELKDG
jgi:hypothetical protein